MTPELDINVAMTNNIKFEKHPDYLMVSISDTTMNMKRGQEILSNIDVECSNYSYKKVLLDERTVEKREVSSNEILEISKDIAQKKLGKIFMAFWCKPELIDRNADLLSTYTFKNKYFIRHFSDKDDAVNWLNEQY